MLAGHVLIEAGALVSFDVVETKVEETQSGVWVQIDLALGEVEEDGEETWRSEDHEQGGLGFMFCLATLSFADSRSRGISDTSFVQVDQLTVADFLQGLRYVGGELQYTADYIRGRCMKTDIVLRPDGTVRLTTRSRGDAAVRWVQRLKGKKVLERVK